MKQTPLAASQRWFVRLLRIYPHNFRQTFGAQVAQVFHDSSREALATSGARGLAGLWLATVPDLFKTALEEHRKEMNMSKILLDPRTRAKIAFVLCLPLAVITLLGAIGVDPSSLPIPASAGIVSGVSLVLMLFGLWLYGAPTGLSALIGLLGTVPFVIMELVNRRSYGDNFPFPLFGIMWLMAAVTAAILFPIAKNLRTSKNSKTNWASLLVRGVILVGVVIGWFTLVADQMPCFLGVPNCD
ncbi:MAG: hypothetical protein KIT08_05460 [Anaerolineales bacterium]|nr:MAG: hypothetical protein KIT08_05460 [Anaerolineales bacterium]